MNNSNIAIIGSHSVEISEFLNSNSHFAIPLLSFEAGSALINQMGGDEFFLDAVENKAKVTALKSITGLDDCAELQSLYAEHRVALLNVFSNSFIGDDLIEVHKHSHTQLPSNNLPRGVSYKIDDTAQGLYNLSIKDNSAEKRYLEAARFVCRRVVEIMVDRYDQFASYKEHLQDIDDLLKNPLKIAGHSVYMPANLVADLAELLGGTGQVISESENLDDGWVSTEFYDRPLALDNSLAVLYVFNRNKEEISVVLSQIAAEKNMTSSFAFINLKMLHCGYNFDMVAEAFWSSTEHTGRSIGMRKELAIAVVTFLTLMLCRTISAYNAGIDA